ncbi:putative nuclease HARBI1 [Ctenocephalides felis]|uniref:putative nuclease HARBI1 n=1 Tax=Ctenocephalides felis TaxID=7515 RepID=UPI000E6E109F|nr:putative nuclease HARBI1 [Ctenocephalides felis]
MLNKVVPLYDEAQFMEHFRVSRNVCKQISDRYKASAIYNLNTYGIYGKISALHQVQIFLWFAGHESASYRDVSDRFDITLSSLHRIIRRVTSFLSCISSEFIKWPNHEEKLLIAEGFLQKGFPNVIGVIDGCHIRINKPAKDSRSFLNRKGYCSINMQAVCNDQNKIIDVFIGCPGSVHDARVFRRSNLGLNLNRKCGRYFLLGDAAYPLKTNLMTPFRNINSLTQTQKHFNKKLNSARSTIEHTFGLLKQNFRQLYHLKIKNIHFICHFIRACCVLHNWSIKENFECLQRNQNLSRLNIESSVEDEVNAEEINARLLRDQIAAALL